ncbi:Ig-like domain-containing protein [Aliivibrio fischeri]|uniref:Ig-like domain-containing protein n=1 Tax=Aliivibrio fischeri TaxID=668 RepID=UPI00080EC350|nr:hypothetical protein [Aliivibrio fischeri]OCH48788.1 hypothetical protein A6E02_08090 [Aliivibrio fischeri]
MKNKEKILLTALILSTLSACKPSGMFYGNSNSNSNTEVNAINANSDMYLNVPVGESKDLFVLNNDTSRLDDILKIQDTSIPNLGSTLLSADRKKIIYSVPTSLDGIASSSEQFNYTINDEHNNTATAVVDITFLQGNLEDLNIQPDFHLAKPSEKLILDISENDISSDTIVYSKPQVVPPEAGSVELTPEGKLTFIASNTFTNKIATITYFAEVISTSTKGTGLAKIFASENEGYEWSPTAVIDSEYPSFSIEPTIDVLPNGRFITDISSFYGKTGIDDSGTHVTYQPTNQSDAGDFIILTESDSVEDVINPTYIPVRLITENIKYTPAAASVYNNSESFSILKLDGSVISWGGGSEFSYEPIDKNNAIVSISSTDSAFAAITREGKVIVWGNREYGGDKTVPESLNNIVSIQGTSRTFSALDDKGKVYSWGYKSKDTTSLVDIVSIYSTKFNFFAITSDGLIYQWGENSSLNENIEITKIKSVTPSQGLDTFISLNEKNQSTFYTNEDPIIPPSNLDNIYSIYSTNKAFAILYKNGDVALTGAKQEGGTINSNEESIVDKEVVSIVPASTAFAALTKDGKVITWGNQDDGGDSQRVADKLVNIASISATEKAFAALTKDGNVITWGNEANGGNSHQVTDKLVNIVSIYSTKEAFAALDKNGNVITWGNESKGGNSTALTQKLKNVISIYSTDKAFAALTIKGHVFYWGSISNLTAENEEQLSKGVKSHFSNIDTDEDGIVNQEEFDSCDFPLPIESIGKNSIPCLDVGNKDSDNDRVIDGFEIDNNLNPLNRDSNVKNNNSSFIYTNIDENKSIDGLDFYPGWQRH